MVNTTAEQGQDAGEIGSAGASESAKRELYRVPSIASDIMKVDQEKDEATSPLEERYDFSLQDIILYDKAKHTRRSDYVIREKIEEKSDFDFIIKRIENKTNQSYQEQESLQSFGYHELEMGMTTQSQYDHVSKSTAHFKRQKTSSTASQKSLEFEARYFMNDSFCSDVIIPPLKVSELRESANADKIIQYPLQD